MRDSCQTTDQTRPAPFIVFEGGEGAGKSSQVAALASAMREQGHRVCSTREPGATALGGQIRALLLDPTAEVTDRAEALLFAADRAQHVAQVIRPALNAGTAVLCDRYIDSSVVYQGLARGSGAGQVAQIQRLSQWASEGLVPDLTILLDIEPALGLSRARRVGMPDRMERKDLGFHIRVRDGFLRLAGQEPARYLVLDASEPSESVAARIWAEVGTWLGPPVQQARSQTVA